LAALPNVVRAGDDDGVQGYSIRLKNKSFTSNDGLGDSGLAVSGSNADKSGVTTPTFAQAEVMMTRRLGLAFFSESRVWFLWFIR
jgi:hypothetical protein